MSERQPDPSAAMSDDDTRETERGADESFHADARNHEPHPAAEDREPDRDDSRHDRVETSGDTMPREVDPKPHREAKQEAGEAKRDGHEPSDEPPPPMPSKWPFIIAGLILLVLIAWSGYGHWQQHQDALATQQQTEDRVPDVKTVEAKLMDEPVPLILPGQTEAFDSASLFARATGYVAERKVDIGSRVKKGDLLIHIAAPDLDQQLAQAQAQLGQTQASLGQAQAQVAQADANLNLAKVTFARTNTLTQQGYETVQNHDNQQANLTSQQAALETAKSGIRVAEANIKAQGATVDRLKALASFENVVAPFTGVITARNVDVGDLLNADTASGTPMFTIARDDVLRVSVYVPQNGAIGIHEGLPATITVPQLPGRMFKGSVARSSVALTASSRSLMAEIDVPNPDGALRPGLYVTINIAVPRAQSEVEVPAEALIFNQHGMQVAVLDQDSKIRMQPVTIDRDLGTAVDLRDGLKGHEQIVVSPPSMLQTGSKVKATPQKQEQDQGGQPAQSQPAKTKGGQTGQDTQAQMDGADHPEKSPHNAQPQNKQAKVETRQKTD
ncbi:efflux RND transporter periplasmic adaptor subunit [Lichenihabitans psoromatis]|uniref:efflux RND transporter periplasmic adaptor subunit n=1 Tax=Lichenihabitans psoromatis TaxID=2528642 RepID=UPI001FE029BD|nr:efflux RND transporter periplasmic adaptor subunit [Lichenihabitans psoromatis]